MGLVAKQSIVNTILLYIGVVIGYINVTILFPRIIGEEGYGLTRVILSVVFIAQHFAMLGTPSMIMKYFPRFSELGSGTLLRYGFKIVTLGTFIIGGILYLLRNPIIALKQEDSPLFEDYYILVIPILAFVVFYVYLSNVCRANLRTVAPMFANEFLVKVLTMALLILTYYNKWSLDTFLYSWATLYSVNVLFLLGYLLRHRLLNFSSGEPLVPSFKRESMEFSLFNMLAGASNGIISNIDIIMLGFMLSTESFARTGVYAIVVYLANATLMPTRGLGTIASPMVSKFTEQNDRVKLLAIYERTSLNQLVTAGFLAIGIYINLPSLFGFMGISYELGMPVFVLIALTRIIQAGTGVNGIIINYSKYFRYTTYFIAGLAVLAIFFNYLLIPRFELIGAATASLISYALFEFMKWIFVWKRLGLQPIGSSHLKALLIGVFLLCIDALIPHLSNPFIDIFLRSSIITMLAVMIVLRVEVSPDLRQIIIKGLNKAGLRIE